jgi:hypothetical protein
VTRWQRFREWVMRAQDVGLCLIRKWWRPATLLGVAAATWINLVLIPLVSWTVPDLAKAALWIGAVGALQWVREWGKVEGVKDD